MFACANDMLSLTPRLSGAALAVALALPQPAGAQIVPDAGGVLRETTPPPRIIPPTPDVAPVPVEPAAPPITAPGGPSFTLKGVRFSGNTVFAADQLQPLVGDRVGQPVTLADLEAIAQRVTDKYRAAGYLLAQAIVPVQEVTDGQVEISVIEGALGKVRLQVDPAAQIRPDVVERILAGLETGRPLRSAALERVMLLLADLPGIAPQAALEQGDEAGTTDLIVTIVPQRQWDLAVDADNFGSHSTSEYRIGVLGRVGSPLRLGDNLDARAQFGAGGRLAYGRISYELPVSGEGTRIGVSYSNLEYELGKEFAVLDGSGRAELYELTATHPFIRSRARNLFGRIGWQEKQLEDRLGLIDRTDEKSIRSVYVGFAYEERDHWFGGGYTSAAVTGFFGDLDLDGAARADDRAGLRTEGHFQRWNYSVSRLNVLTTKTNLFFGIAGQFADENLDSAEKIALGGPRAVRAYAPTEAAMDEGHVANLELRYGLTPEISLQGFYDWGWGKFNRKPLGSDSDNELWLRGYGVGTFWGEQNGMTLRASLAWRGTERGVTASDRVPRLYMQLVNSF